MPGVAAVERLGGYLRQFQVLIDPARMSARGVSLDEVMHAVESANDNASGGFVVQGPMEWNVRAVGMAQIDRGSARHGGGRAGRRTRCCSATSRMCAKLPRFGAGSLID